MNERSEETIKRLNELHKVDKHDLLEWRNSPECRKWKIEHDQ